MITKIHSTTIVVSDQDISLDFYVNKLGWEKRIDNAMGPDHRFLTVAPVGSETELVLGQAHIYSVEPGAGVTNAEHGMGPQSGISLAVENFDETYRTLVDRGVRFAKPPEVMPWGDKATWLLDPDGNSFFFVGR
jgi:catechol 2,3-dioxygenase-like lactoylglutathione lyase family enzyme